MEQFQCKMCGGSLGGGSETVVTCPHCSSRQTLPRLENPSRACFFAMINELRREKKYDRAISVCQQLLSEERNSAEVYWLLALCQYGVEYTKQSQSGQYAPVVSRPQETPFAENENYKAALQCADSAQRAVYEAEAKAIDAQAKKTEKKAKSSGRRGFAVATVTVLLCAAALGYVIWTYALLPQFKYDDAVSLMKKGQYQEAIDAFKKLGNYEDISAQIARCEEKLMKGTNNSTDQVKDTLDDDTTETMKQVKAGDEICFGSYEQDGVSTGTEAIQWLVLEVKDGKALLISKYALSAGCYHKNYTNFTWESSNLRQWVNNEFLNAAFTREEKAMLAGFPDSDDQVSLLTVEEAEKYFSSSDARKCEATAVAKEGGTYFYSDHGTCWWWLRSPGKDENSVVYIDGVGNIRPQGNRCDYGSGAVRPVVWIDLNA